MTLSTEADHTYSDEVSRVLGNLADHVSAATEAEEHVIELEGTEDDPAVVRDIGWQARQVADEVEEEARDVAGCYTDSDSIADSAAVEHGNHAFELVKNGIRDSPCIVLPKE